MSCHPFIINTSKLLRGKQVIYIYMLLGTGPEEWSRLLRECIFNELAEDVEVSPTHPRGVPFLKWDKDYEQTAQNANDEGSFSTNLDNPWIRWNRMKRRKHEKKEKLHDKLKLGEGLTTYILWQPKGLDPSVRSVPHEHEGLQAGEWPKL